MERLLRMPEVTQITGFKRAWIYVLMRRGDFPAPLKIGPRAVRWKSSEIYAWLESQPKAEYQD
jgi:prophage regulatory protein